MKKSLSLLALSLWALGAQAQTAEDAAFVKGLYQQALGEQQGYRWLANLCSEAGPRLAGSEGDAKGVKWAVETLDTLGFDRVFTQPVDVRHWARGVETAECLQGKTKRPLRVTALGGSVGTPGGDKGPGVTAKVIEIVGREDLAAKGHLLAGNIVFYNEPMDPWLINTGSSYGKAGWQRWGGASEAAKYGALGVLVRSLTHRNDDFPHTGAMAYEEGVTKIPAAGISTNDANWLSAELKKNPNLQVHYTLGCHEVGRAMSANVIAEWKGSEFPDQVMLVGGHLDSWDLGTGAQDDGAGVVHSMQALWLLKQAGYQPRHTMRIVLFANEEFGLEGARDYAATGLESGRTHIAGVESDGGSGAPRGFSLPGFFHEEHPEIIEALNTLLSPYGCREWTQGGSGADVGQITDEGAIIMGYRGDSQRYFDYHHTAQDNIESVHPRELELGSASMAALMYYLDKSL